MNGHLVATLLRRQRSRVEERWKGRGRKATLWIPIFAAPWQILVANLLPREGESPLLALKSRLSALQPSYPCLAANNPAVVVTAFAKAMSAPFHSRIAENASPTHSPPPFPFGFGPGRSLSDFSLQRDTFVCICKKRQIQKKIGRKFRKFRKFFVAQNCL